MRWNFWVARLQLHTSQCFKLCVMLLGFLQLNKSPRKSHTYSSWTTVNVSYTSALGYERDNVYKWDDICKMLHGKWKSHTAAQGMEGGYLLLCIFVAALMRPAGAPIRDHCLDSSTLELVAPRTDKGRMTSAVLLQRVIRPNTILNDCEGDYVRLVVSDFTL